MNRETSAKYNIIGPCGLTHLLTNERPTVYYIDKYVEPYRSLIFEYKTAYQELQLTILADSSESEMGRCFKKLEERFDKLIHNFAKED